MSADPSQASRSFDPMAEDTRALRNAFGKFATGVTVVTCAGDDGPVCITANSFSSISLEPPLVMWAMGKNTQRHAYFQAASHFAIHVLKANQKALCLDAARDRFALRHVPHGLGRSGTPLLEDCLVRFECATVAQYEAGDHTILLGQVERVTESEGPALLFFQGGLESYSAP